MTVDEPGWKGPSESWMQGLPE